MVPVPLLFPWTPASAPPHAAAAQRPSLTDTGQGHATGGAPHAPPPRLVVILVPARPAMPAAIRVDRAAASMDGAKGGVLLDPQTPAPNMYVCRAWQCMTGTGRHP